VTAVALFNFTFAIIPYSRVSANQAVEFAFRLKPALANGAIVYFSDFNTDDWFARYFNPQTKWRPAQEAAIDADLRAGQACMAGDDRHRPVLRDRRTLADRAARGRRVARACQR
jgi:hypothetical protein